MNQETRILAIDPFSTGFGWVVLEGPDRLIDWGHAYTKEGMGSGPTARIAEMMDFYEPEVLVLEDPTGEGSRRGRYAKRIIAAAARYADRWGAKVQHYSRGQIRMAFEAEDAFTKEEIAAAIAARFPELHPQLPPHRKIWMSEDHRMAIFDAASLALTALRVRQRVKSKTQSRSLSRAVVVPLRDKERPRANPWPSCHWRASAKSSTLTSSRSKTWVSSKTSLPRIPRTHSITRTTCF